MAVHETGFLAEAMHLASRVGEKTKEKGAAHVALAAARWLAAPALTPVYKHLRRGREFQFEGRSLPYFWHRYNMTWRNERAIEVPIVWDAIKRVGTGRILEVGNVLSHYYAFDHDILDKYEKAEGVINEDVIDFRPSALYDLIISVSTLEHVGWDESPRNADKVPQVLAAMEKWLAPGGRLIVTVPFGYNDFLDEHLRKKTVRFDEQHYFVRTADDNRWRETTWDDISTAKYGVPYPDSSGHLVVGVTHAKTGPS